MKKIIYFLECILAVTISILIYCPPADSSIVASLSKKDLVAKSDSIVVGTVVDEVSDWNSTGRFIVTYTRIRILDDVKGSENGSSEIVVKNIGGKVGNREMIVHGAARFSVGEKTLLFLRKDTAGFKNVVGLALGKFRIIKDPLSGEELAVNPANPEIKLVHKSFNGKIVEEKSSSLGSSSLLKDFIAEIKREIKGGEETNR